MASLAEMFGLSGREGETFLGLPFCDDMTTLEGGAAILGIATATPYPSVGAYCAEAPACLRAATAPYAANRGAMNFDLGGPVFPDGAPGAVDCGDLPIDPENPAANRALIRERVETLLARGAVPVVIGGDDSVPIPVLAAYEGQGPLTVLQIDAHPDWRDEVGGERFGLSSTMRRASEMDHVARIVQVGLRGMGSARPGDWQAAQDRGARMVSGQDLAERGIAPALAEIPEGARVFVSLDVDALDPAIMPAVIGRTPGGMSYWQLVGLLQGVAERAEIAGFALVEFMPARDIDGQGALLASQVLVNALGLIARQQARR